MNLKELIQEAFYAPNEVRPFDIMLMYQYWTNKSKGESDREAKIHAAQTAVRVAIRVMRGRKSEAEYVASKSGKKEVATKKKLSPQDWLDVWNKAVERLGDTKWFSTLKKVKTLIDKGLSYNEVKAALGVKSKLPWKKR